MGVGGAGRDVTRPRLEVRGELALDHRLLLPPSCSPSSQATLDAALPPPPSPSLNTRARAIRHDARRQDTQTPSPIRQRRQDPASTECMDPLPLPPVQGAQEESGQQQHAPAARAVRHIRRDITNVEGAEC